MLCVRALTFFPYPRSELGATIKGLFIHPVSGEVEEFFERDIFSEKIYFNLYQAHTIFLSAAAEAVEPV